jgi:hypothetical protein
MPLLALACGLLISGIPCRAQADDARYSLGAVQPVTEFEVAEGVDGSTWLGFYNIDGTVPTTVALLLVSFPESWRVTLSTDALLSGTDHATLAVEPSSPAQQPQECGEPAAKSVWLSGRGYVCAEAVWRHVLVPASGEGPAEATVVVRATATWAAQGSFQQERDFVYVVRVAEAPAGRREWLPPALAAAAAAALLAVWWRRRIAKSAIVD